MRAAIAALRGANAFAARHPLAVSLSVSGAKAASADLLVQTVVEKTDRVDWVRTGVFGIFGCGYQGGFQYFFINRGFELVWPGLGMRNVLKKIAAANLISDPLFFFPTFYTLKEALNTQRLGAETVRSALGNYRSNFLEDWRNSWLIWVPGHTVTYALMPTHLRMPWIAVVSFAYVSLLSLTRGKYNTSEEQASTDEKLQRSRSKGGSFVMSS